MPHIIDAINLKTKNLILVECHDMESRGAEVMTTLIFEPLYESRDAIRIPFSQCDSKFTYATPLNNSLTHVGPEAMYRASLFYPAISSVQDEKAAKEKSEDDSP